MSPQVNLTPAGGDGTSMRCPERGVKPQHAGFQEPASLLKHVKVDFLGNKSRAAGNV